MVGKFEWDWSVSTHILIATVSGGGEVGQVGKPLVSIAIVYRVPALHSPLVLGTNL